MGEKSIFLEAIRLADPALRPALLDARCGGDEALRHRVESLLRAHDASGAFLETPAGRRPALPDSKAAGPGLDFLARSDLPGSLGRLGPYEVLEVLGRGATGVVLRASDPRLGRMVAIKILAPELAASPMALRRFAREARAAAAVCHEHVVAIHGVEGDHVPPYLVMHFVQGGSLQQKIDRQGPLGLAEVLRVGMQAAAGLAAAHVQGLVHRDIKPANLMLENGVERVKITDFGLARAADDASLTQNGVIAGTPDFMAPEQAEGRPVDHRSDLFSLGSVLYAACTGRPPFSAESTVAVLRRVCDEQPRPIRDLVPEVPDWLCSIVTRLHEKDPARRFGSAGEVVDLLGRCLAAVQQGRPVPPALLAEIVAAPDAREPSAGRREGRWLAGAAAILAIVAGVAASEATGVTRLAGTAVRLVRPEGTLVVESDDPGISVTVGDEGLVISGAGPREIRLKPGLYPVRAEKGGKVLSEELVTVERDGRRVVRVSREPARPEVDPVKELAARLRAANPDFNERFGAEVSGGEIVDLELTTNVITDLGPLRGLRGLKQLWLRGAGAERSLLEDLRPLAGLSLKNLVLVSSHVSDLSPLRGMPLTGFCCVECPVSDLSPLSGLGLKGLTLWDLPVADLSPLKGLPLRSISLWKLPAADLAPLAGMRLETVNLNQCGFRDLSPLRGMPLRGVELLNLPVEDLEPLRGAPIGKLTYVNLAARDVSVVRGLPLRRLFCDYRPDRDEAVLRAIPTLETINEKPAAAFWKEIGPPSVP